MPMMVSDADSRISLQTGECVVKMCDGKMDVPAAAAATAAANGGSAAAHASALGRLVDQLTGSSRDRLSAVDYLLRKGVRCILFFPTRPLL